MPRCPQGPLDLCNYTANNPSGRSSADHSGALTLRMCALSSRQPLPETIHQRLAASPPFAAIVAV